MRPTSWIGTRFERIPSSFQRAALVLLTFISSTNCQAEEASLGSLATTVQTAERKTVKLYGAGGMAGLDAYQSGIFISDTGHILTVWSTVLDVEDVIVVCSDGARVTAKTVGIDPNLEIAVLKADHQPVGFFPLGQAVEAQTGERVLAFSNLFGIATGTEMSSVQKGAVMARTDLNARRGSIQSVYGGPVYLIDAMTNNPGAAGGALTNSRGQLVGLLGKELRDTAAGIWVNYAVPVGEIKESVQSILAGKSIVRREDNRTVADRPTALSQLGIALIPNVLSKTPAFVDLVQPESSAEKAGLQGDDLILFVNSSRVASQESLLSELKYIDRTEPLVLLIQRGGKLLEVVVK